MDTIWSTSEASKIGEVSHMRLVGQARGYSLTLNVRECAVRFERAQGNFLFYVGGCDRFDEPLMQVLEELQ